MWEFIDLIFFAGISGAYIWLFLHDRKLEKPEVNVTVNVPETKVINNPGTHTITLDTSGELDLKSTTTDVGNLDSGQVTPTKTTEIPIDEPDRSDDWLNIEPTDSN